MGKIYQPSNVTNVERCLAQFEGMLKFFKGYHEVINVKTHDKICKV